MKTAAVLLPTLWGVCAIYYGDSRTGMLQTVLAAGFGLSGMLTAAAWLWAFSFRFRLMGVHAALSFCILAWWLHIAPANDRAWQDDVARLSHAIIDGDLVTVHNIRNFDYRSEFDYRPAYYDKTFDLNKLEGVDLFAVYWMGPAIAHTIVSFDFGGGDHLAVSIEARKEKHEGYSTIKGFFRQYELVYIVADERDIIRLRTNYRNDPKEQVYLYRLQGPLENGRRLFLEYMTRLNDLRAHPDFYNTLTTNCTTTVWMNTRINPTHLPFSWKIIASGYVPEYLYESGRLDRRLPFADLERIAHINDIAKKADRSPGFSERLRAAYSRLQAK